MKRYLGTILHIANGTPPPVDWWRKRLYRLKARLLKTYGTHVSVDLQHIIKECYRCWEIRQDWIDVDDPPFCWRCGDTGIWDEFWVVLDVYELGGYRFHIPRVRQRVLRSLRGLAVPCRPIEGYIKHKGSDQHLAIKRHVLLALLFDLYLFWRIVKLWCSLQGHNLRIVLRERRIVLGTYWKLKVWWTLQTMCELSM